MKRPFAITVLLFCATVAMAELQDVDIGGQLRIRARYWSNMFVDGEPEVRIPDFFLPGRAIGPFGTASELAWDDKSNDKMKFEQNTKLTFRAEFTGNVSGQFDLFSRETWGQNFRSDYVTGADFRADTSRDIEVLQSYIAVQEMFGVPLQLRIGRQQIEIGDGWLVGKKHSTDEFAFDGVRFTYTADPFTIDGWWSVLAESGIQEQDGDVDFYGLNATYTGLAGHEFMAYWFFVRDARSLNDTNFIAPIERLENWAGVDDYDPTELHTFGVRAEGELDALDYVWEAAYQTGNADQIGRFFSPFGYGDTGARFDSWAGDLELGYTFDVAWRPRIFIGGAYFGGEDNRDLTFFEWINPFDRPEASVSFNRLFSVTKYGELFGQDRNASNFSQLRFGSDLEPMEAITLTAALMKYWVNETFDTPRTISAGAFRIPVAPALPFLTESAGDDIGTIASFDLRYHYSEDLEFRLVVEHFLADGDIAEGNFIYSNGLEFNGGSDSDNATYVALDTLITF